nr:endolytic transglycosylase MltG [Amycolatopsis cihanbeyliensis]
MPTEGAPPRPAPPRPRRQPAPGEFSQHRGELGGPPGDIPPPPNPQVPRGGRRRRYVEGPPPDERPTEVLHLDHDWFDEPRPRPDRDHDPDSPDEDFYDEYDGEYYDEEYYDEDGYADEDDDDEDRAEPEYFDDGRDEPPRRTRGRRGKRALGWIGAIAVIVLLAGAAWFGARELLGFGYADYEGDGESDVLLQVADGDSTSSIAGKLEDSDVVASAKAFVEASEDDSRVLSVQPGYYVMKTKMSGASAVRQLVSPQARVGQLEVRGGTELDDTILPDDKVSEGVLSLLSKASCADLNGTSTCVPVEELRTAAETADLAALGAPPWAAEAVAKVEGDRKIEGLITPGVYDVRPGADANELLGTVLKESASRLRATGLPGDAEPTGKAPYEVLIIASVIEREAVKQDFEKVSRVIYNRLDAGMKLEMDSTVNYPLDEPVIRTDPADRQRPGPYNTYQNTGLPPTPIGAPSAQAIEAAEEPAEGDWLFFVKCEENGLSCFSESYEEHRRNVDDAQSRGVF